VLRSLQFDREVDIGVEYSSIYLLICVCNKFDVLFCLCRIFVVDKDTDNNYIINENKLLKIKTVIYKF